MCCPVIQRDVNGQLAKDAFEQYAGGTDFYSDMFVVHKKYGVWHILNHRGFNLYMHAPIIRQVWQLIQLDDYTLFTDFKDTLCIFILLSIIILCILFGKINFISGRFCHLCTSFTKPILFLCQYKVFHNIISLDNILFYLF